MERKPLTLGKISFTGIKNGNFDFEQGFVTNDAYMVRMLRVSPAVCTTTDTRIFVSSNKNRNKTKGGVK